MEITLVRANIQDAENLWKMQTVAFQDLYAKYQDPETSQKLCSKGHSFSIDDVWALLRNPKGGRCDSPIDLPVAPNNLSDNNASGTIISADPYDLSGRAVSGSAPGLPVCCSLPVTAAYRH